MQVAVVEQVVMRCIPMCMAQGPIERIRDRAVLLVRTAATRHSTLRTAWLSAEVLVAMRHQTVRMAVAEAVLIQRPLIRHKARDRKDTMVAVLCLRERVLFQALLRQVAVVLAVLPTMRWLRSPMVCLLHQVSVPIFTATMWAVAVLDMVRQVVMDFKSATEVHMEAVKVETLRFQVDQEHTEWEEQEEAVAGL